MRTRYRISTEADTGSKARRSRTWDVEADTVDDAISDARIQHVRLVGWNASVWVTAVREQ